MLYAAEFSTTLNRKIMSNNASYTNDGIFSGDDNMGINVANPSVTIFSLVERSNLTTPEPSWMALLIPRGDLDRGEI
jgi:hypothetical protein